MNEAFLHHIWKFSLYNSNGLATTDGERVEVIKAGQHNTDSGPDFFNAQVKIGETLWAGNVEIHLKSSEWNRHSHTADASYNNVVLHVVYEHDEEVFTQEHIRMVTLELKGRFDPALFRNYQNLIESSRWIPCESRISQVDDITISTWLERLLIERLENKTRSVLESLRQNKNNWEDAFYHLLARNFGFRTNSLPFELLARSLPLSYLRKHNDQPKQIEALLFGQSGLLEKKFRDDYANNLKTEYEFLRKKYGLSPMDGSQWKFLRLRPSNFPTIRIAQFAWMMNNSHGLFSKVLEAESVETLCSLFSASLSDYWNSHYTFDRPSPVHKKSLGEGAIHNIVVNTAVPSLFAYGTYWNDESIKNKALHFLEKLGPETNAIIDKWNALGLTSSNAGRTQALLQLKNDYCNLKKCLICSVGNKIINSIS